MAVILGERGLAQGCCLVGSERRVGRSAMDEDTLRPTLFFPWPGPQLFGACSCVVVLLLTYRCSLSFRVTVLLLTYNRLAFFSSLSEL